MNCKRGDIIVLELNNGDVYDGILYTSSTYRLSLTSAVEYPSGKLYENICEFSLQEIKTIRQITDTKTEDRIFMNLSEYKHLTNLINSYKLINQLDVRYFDALRNLDQAETIAVDAKGAGYGRFRKISYLVLATWSQVFVFDLTILDTVAFDTGLRLLLENEFITKICHNSKLLHDCLVHKYNVKLKNIFDTQIADQNLRKGSDNLQLRSMAECVMTYMNMPESYIDKTKDEEYDTKPLPQQTKEGLGINCTFLIFLKMELQKKMLKDLHTLTDLYYGTYTKSTIGLPPIEQTNFPEEFLSELH